MAPEAARTKPVLPTNVGENGEEPRLNREPETVPTRRST